MKYTPLLLLAILAFATCKLSFLSNAFTEPEDSSDDPIDQFFEGLFDYYSLSKPTQILQCFNDKSASLFFDTLYEKYDLLQDATNRAGELKIHLDCAKLKLLYNAIQSTVACAFISQDISDLLEALDIKRRDPEKFGMALYLNLQAHYDDLYNAYEPMIQYLTAKNFTAAGNTYGDILNYTVKTIRKEGSSLQAFNAFGNGFSVGLDIDEPSDSLECYDNDTSAYGLQFIYKLSVAVTDGKFYEAPVNTLNFYQNEGKEILSKVPESVMDCDNESNDHQTVSDKLGIDIYTEEFGELLKRYINNHRLAYYGYLKGIRSSFEDHDFIHAGKIYSNFISAVASKNDSGR